MQKISIVFILAVPVLSVSVVLAATDESDETPGPIPVSVSPCSPNCNMPLALYRSLREKALLLADAAPQAPASSTGNAAPQHSPHAVLAQLAGEVREHEAEILEALHSPRTIQRELAARVLSLAADKKPVVTALCAAVVNDSDADVRVTAAFTLGRIGDAAAVEALLTGLKDSSENVRTQCIAALGRIRDERAVTDLMQILRSDLRPLLRLQAAGSLAQIKTGVSESDLAGLLDSEGDERVKMAIASAVRTVTGTKSPEIAEVPDHGDYQKQLSDLSGQMKSVEQKLRDDRFDEVVQVDQNDIDEKLGDMIRELEKMQIMRQEMREQTDRKQTSKRRLSMMGEDEITRTPRSSAPRPPSPVANESRVNAGRVVGRENWASLPQAERDELLQVFRPEVPLRWRKRLEAYFVSLAAEEAKAEKK